MKNKEEKWKGVETMTIAAEPLGYDEKRDSEVMAGDVGWVV